MHSRLFCLVGMGDRSLHHQHVQSYFEVRVNQGNIGGDDFLWTWPVVTKLCAFLQMMVPALSIQKPEFVLERDDHIPGTLKIDVSLVIAVGVDMYHKIAQLLPKYEWA